MRSNLPYVRHDVCTKRSTCPTTTLMIIAPQPAELLTTPPRLPCTSFQTALWLLVGLLSNSIPTSTSSSRCVSRPWSVDRGVVFAPIRGEGEKSLDSICMYKMGSWRRVWRSNSISCFGIRHVKIEVMIMLPSFVILMLKWLKILV